MDQRTSRNPFDAPPGGARPRGSRWGIRYVPGGMRTVVVAAALLVVALVVVFLQPSQPPPRRNFFGANQAMPVGVAQAINGDIDINLNALGTVTPLATVTVKPQVSGQLLRVAFTEGQLVQPGQLLAEIDPRPYQAALDQAQGQLARDQALLANAKLDLARYQTLIQQNSIAQQQVDTQSALVRQDEGIVKSDEANVESAQINLNYTKIKSPIAGRVGLRQVDVGNLVTAGQTAGIVTVTQLQPISVVFSVPEDNVGDIMDRVRSGAVLSVEAYDRAQTKMLATGTVTTVDNVIDTTTGTVKLRANFDNAKSELFPNQFVNIRLQVNTLHNQIVVPTAAIQRGASGTYVYAVNPDRTVSMRTVTLGQTQDDKVAVVSGVMAGDTLVTDGADRLRDGSKVTLPGDNPPAAADGTAAPNAPPAANPDQNQNQHRGRAGGRRGRGGGAGAGNGGG